MATSDYHLAQINIAKMLGPIDGPIMADFVAQLDEINTLAEQSPGYIWRLQDETGNSSSIQAYEDPMIIVNLSVWESVEMLAQFAYQSDHAEVYRQKRKWFEPITPNYAMWWVPAGHIPTTEEGKQRLETLGENGPSPEAFTFGKKFPAP